MSQLRIKTSQFGTFDLNVLRFESSLFATTNSIQTRRMTQHFPIKVQQPSIRFDVIFRSEAEYERFQRYVRAGQVQALLSGQESVTLMWPERNILNWTGVIKEFRAGGKRFNYTPRATFVVDLVDSMISRKTDMSSITSEFVSVVGEDIVNLYSQQIYNIENQFLMPPNPVGRMPSIGSALGSNIMGNT